MVRASEARGVNERQRVSLAVVSEEMASEARGVNERQRVSLSYEHEERAPASPAMRVEIGSVASEETSDR